MFYILSRFFACLASPVTYMLIMLIVAACTKRKWLKRGMIAATIILFLTTTNHMIYSKAERLWCGECLVDIDTTKHYDFAIVPGGVTGMDSIRGRVEYGEAADRIIDCAWLMNIGVVDNMIVTGDGASNRASREEPFRQHMKDVYGIDGDRIFIEPDAKNTIENFTLTLERFGTELQGKEILVVNSARYMRRTMLCCRMTGLECDFYTVDINTAGNGSWEDWVPDLGTLDYWMKLIHEWIGYVAYQFY